MGKKKLLIWGLAVLVVGLAGAGVVVARNSSHLTNAMQQLPASNLATDAGTDHTKMPDAADRATGQAVDEKGIEGGRPQGGPRMMFSPEDIAQLLGMTAEELRAGLKAGTTLEQIVSNKGMTLAELKEKLLAKTKTELDTQVSQGQLTAEQAQSLLARLQDMDLRKLGAGPEKGGNESQQTPAPNSNQQN